MMHKNILVISISICSVCCSFASDISKKCYKYNDLIVSSSVILEGSITENYFRMKEDHDIRELASKGKLERFGIKPAMIEEFNNFISKKPRSYSIEYTFLNHGSSYLNTFFYAPVRTFALKETCDESIIYENVKFSYYHSDRSVKVEDFDSIDKYYRYSFNPVAFVYPLSIVIPEEVTFSDFNDGKSIIVCNQSYMNKDISIFVAIPAGVSPLYITIKYILSVADNNRISGTGCLRTATI